MSTRMFLGSLLLVLFLQVSCEEAEPMFRAVDSVIELGYCFGVDYIVVYRSGPEGDQLLGNSSDDSTPVQLPADLQGRVSLNQDQNLLGLQISDLTHLDSGTYRRECWQKGTRVSTHTHQLCVCGEEVGSAEIVEKEDGEVSELLCNHTSLGQDGTSVRWYREKYPSYHMTLFLDSAVSLDPLLDELKDIMEVREGGAVLLLSSTMLKNNHHFYCLVIRAENCLSFQNFFVPDRSESRDVFSSPGDRVVLKCSSEGNHQLWETPLGRLDANSTKNQLMFISLGEKSKDFSLVIPAASEDHSGDYSCMSSSLEVQYSLVLCPTKPSERTVFDVGANVTLTCDVRNQSFQSVLWYRLDPSGQHELIHDSTDDTLPVPADLIGRLTLSENGSSLSLAHLEGRDRGRYWCVVLRGSVFVEEEDDDYEDDYGEEFTTEEETDEQPDWQDTNTCIFKQDTMLALNQTTPRSPETDLMPDPPAPDMTLYAVGAGLAGLLVLSVVAVVIVVKMRARSSQSPGEGVRRSPDRDTTEDPGCTESLTQNDEHRA